LPRLRELLKEPLLHFLLLGLALFALYAVVSPDRLEGEKVTITQGAVDDIQRQFVGLWNRPPTAAELKALIESRIHNEIVYREGVSLGLDKDDAVIQRRVRQKYDLMAEENAAGGAPSDADLEAYLKAHPDRFAKPPSVTFDQILLNPTGDPDAAVAATLKALASGADPAGLGGVSLLPRHVTAEPLDLVSKDFGADFARAVAAAPLGVWSPPVSSGFGYHLIRVSARTPAKAPALAEVRDEVAREWENDRRNRAAEADYAKLRRKYQVVVEAKLPPEARP
jgi:parvulin-like peptidyl-prolyl isomerase